MTSTQQRRPGDDPETAAVSLAADSRVQRPAIGLRMRVALDASLVSPYGGLTSEGRTLFILDDMPAGSQLVLDVTRLAWPIAEVTHALALALERGVLVDIEAASADDLLRWRRAIWEWFA